MEKVEAATWDEIAPILEKNRRRFKNLYRRLARIRTVKQPYLSAEEDSTLAKIWDNEDDGIFDQGEEDTIEHRP